MTLEQMKRKYAYTLARLGVNVQKGQTVVVEAAIEGADFTPIFAEECYKLGAGNVVVHYHDEPNMKIAAKYRSDEDMRKLENWEIERYQKYFDEGACIARLEGVNPLLMEDVPESQANAIFAHTDTMRNVFRKAVREKGIQWVIAMIPTQQWAEYIMKDVPKDKALEELWKLLLKICYIDEDNDVVATYAENSKKKMERGNKLDSYNFTKFHYTSSNGTDLTVQLTPYTKFGNGNRKPDPNRIVYHANIPSEELCSSPEKFGTEGVVYATKPLVLGGKKIENFGFRFEKGKVVEVIAEEGKEMLEALVNMDENAGYLGEVALVEYHSPISMSDIVYYCTLIDENASCHLALGRALGRPLPEDDPYTFNDSVIHIDFMMGAADMRIVGTTPDGQEVTVFENGDFAL